jgi:DNA-binding GntR family transcriptional regulator
VSATASASRAAELTEILTAEILRGKHPAGTPLRQGQLADRFDVSRTPVREALHRLVATGLATFRPNSGFRVRGVPRDEYLQAMVIRSRLEGLAAERAVERITRRQLRKVASTADELDEIGRRLSASPERKDYLRDQNLWSRKNAEFHNLLVDLADCAPLTSAMLTTVRSFPREVTWLAAERFPGLLAEYARDHQGICEALSVGAGQVARARAQAHVERAIRYLELVFDSEEQRSS